MLRYNFSERRKFYRVYANIPIVCESPDPKDNTIHSKTAMIKDISSGGVYLEIDEILSLRMEINVTFQLPKSNNIIRAAIRVVRVETIEAEENFGIGALFVRIADKDREEIRQLVERLDIDKLLELCIKNGASDLHLLAEQAPVLRLHGELGVLDMPKLYADEIPQLLYSVMTKQQIRLFEKEKELDFGIQYDMQNRFRVNVHQQKGFIEAAFRLINTKFFSFEELNIPEVVKDLARQNDGLILITGPTGSGKTTTMAAMVDLINRERKAVVITLERPIEYVHANIKSIIKQREIGIDTNSFSVALKSSLRQDPNIIVIGELEDIETVRTALIAAEAGYLVIASFHSPNTLQAIDRLVGMFPMDNRRQVLSQLANCLKGVVTQLLLPRRDKKGRILASEVLVVNDAVKNLIRNDELYQIPTIIQTGAAYKMQPMLQLIKKYFDQGIIDSHTVDLYSKEPGMRPR